MKFRTKSLLSIIAVCSCASLFCVGFANWVIVQDGPIESVLTGGVHAESVIFSNAYISIVEGDIKTFTYSQNGFINEGSTATSYEGTMTVPLTVDNAKCSELAGVGGSLTVTVEMTLSVKTETGLFDYTSVAASGTDATIAEPTGTYNQELGSYSTTFTLTPSGTEKTTVDLVYKFDLQNKENYTNLVYNVFGESEEKNKENNISFMFTITLTNSGASGTTVQSSQAGVRV